MDKAFLRALQADFPAFELLAGDLFCWSHERQRITYEPDGSAASLLHEYGHALLGHAAFRSDVDLINKEVAAWERAKQLAAVYEIPIDDDAIGQCLDSYRDWLFQRSTCPKCGAHGVQNTQRTYACLNCNKTWDVTRSVQCRPYRRHVYS